MEKKEKIAAAEIKTAVAKKDKPKLTPVLTILEEAIKIWWKNLKKIIMVYLWGALFALIPVAIVLAVISLNIWVKGNLGLIIASSVIIIAGILMAAYFLIRGYMGIFILVKDNYIGKELDIFKATRKLFWPYLGLTVLTSIFILLWTLLLIIPGIIFSVFYSLACYVFFFEGKKGMAAIRRSTELVKNYWWPVFGRFIVVTIAIWLLMMVVSLPLAGVSEDSLFFHFWNILIQTVNFLVGPIVLLFSYRIYQDLVKIKKHEA
jgi:hypothetical protein